MHVWFWGRAPLNSNWKEQTHYYHICRLQRLPAQTDPW